MQRLLGMVDTRMTRSADADDSAADDDAPPRLAAGRRGDVVLAKMLKMAVLYKKGTPDEAAGAVLMLASPYASYITGATRVHWRHGDSRARRRRRRLRGDGVRGAVGVLSDAAPTTVRRRRASVGRRRGRPSTILSPALW